MSFLPNSMLVDHLLHKDSNVAHFFCRRDAQRKPEQLSLVLASCF